VFAHVHYSSRRGAASVRPGAKGIMAAMDRASRRPAIVVVVVGGIAGAAMIAALQTYREPLEQWLLSDPAQTPARARLLIAAVGSLLVFPLLAFAAYAWSIAGAMDASRARGLKAVAVILVAGALMLAAVLWRLSVVLTSRPD
jgi:hypothetical protein